MAQKIKTLDINKESVEIYVNTSTGQFYGEFDDREYREDSLPDLEKKLKDAGRRARALKPVPISIVGLVLANEVSRRSIFADGPFTEGYGIVDAFLRGRNDRTRRWLMLTTNREKFQYGGHGADGPIIARRLTQAEKDEYTVLALAVAEATKALEEFKARVKVDPHKLVAGKIEEED